MTFLFVFCLVFQGHGTQVAQQLGDRSWAVVLGSRRRGDVKVLCKTRSLVNPRVVLESKREIPCVHYKSASQWKPNSF